MLDVEEATGAAPVDDFIERVGFVAVGVGVERDVPGGEVVGGAVAPGFLADVLLCWTPVFRRSRRLQRG